MQDKVLSLLAIFDSATQDRLGDYYDILFQNGFIGTQTKDVPYHFTLGSRSVDYEEQMINELNIICSETPCIDISLGYIGLFGQRVIFVAPCMNFELQKLQNRFFDDCGNGCHKWAAHATLLLDEPQAILEALPIVTEKFQPFKARIESVALYEFFPKRFVKECMLT
jgi:2'-5' RNA ligase